MWFFVKIKKDFFTKNTGILEEILRWSHVDILNCAVQRKDWVGQKTYLNWGLPTYSYTPLPSIWDAGVFFSTIFTSHSCILYFSCNNKAGIFILFPFGKVPSAWHDRSIYILLWLQNQKFEITCNCKETTALTLFLKNHWRVGVTRAREETKLATIEEEKNDDNGLGEDVDPHLWLLPWLPPSLNATTIPKGFCNHTD